MEPDSEAPETDLEATRAELQRRQEGLQELDKRLAVLAASGESLQNDLAELDETEELERELEALYREEGIALAAHDAFTSAGRAITEHYVEPVAKEVESRWKRMFGSGGLTLSSEGRITRQLGSRTLEFGSLSGGEKVWALLLTRLLISSASTRAPFVWLDEPLEHLDPRLRKVVAGTLAKAASGAGLRQVIVTTYESGLARQLMEDVPSASLLYVTGSDCAFRFSGRIDNHSRPTEDRRNADVRRDPDARPRARASRAVPPRAVRPLRQDAALVLRSRRCGARDLPACMAEPRLVPGTCQRSLMALSHRHERLLRHARRAPTSCPPGGSRTRV